MSHVVALAVALVNKVLHNADIVKGKGHQTVQKIIVIAPHVNDLRTLFLHHLHENLEEVCVTGLPLAGTSLTQSPSIDNVSVQYQAAAVHRFQEIGDFGCLGM